MSTIRHRAPRSVTLLDVFESVARQIEQAARGAAWPSPKYQAAPVEFCREILGVEPWAKQIEILETVRDYQRVAVASGHRTGKSETAAILALWFYCSYAEARVVMTAPVARQVDQILYRAVRRRHGAAKVPLDGEVHELARSGIKGSGFREIVGLTARDQEAVAGIAGPHLLFLADEASGIDDPIYEAMRGNMAGGARLVAFSNPTRTHGWFYEAFGRETFWKTIRVSSEESPNVVAGREVIPGLATREWVEEMREEYGAESALFKIRVKGEHALSEDGKIVSVHAIAQAEARWDETPAEGRLQIGIDPAGPSGDGDETAFAARRGQKVIEVYTRRGLTEDGIVAEALGMARKLSARREHPIPVIALDRDGPIGAAVFYKLKSLGEAGQRFELAAVRSSDKATRQPDLYDRVRDELHASVAKWIAEGGALPTDPKLAKDLNATSWEVQINGKWKATPKSEIRRVLGRSPDRADAVMLATWEPRVYAPAAAERDEPAIDDAYEARDWAANALDPYRSLDAWRQR